MTKSLIIKYDHLVHRRKPDEIFESICLYMRAYKDFGQLISYSIGVSDDFEFQLDEIKIGSVLTKLSIITKKIHVHFASMIFHAGDALFKDLIDVGATESEGDVESLALKLEASLISSSFNQMEEPYIDRQQLAYVLKAFSDANNKVAHGETVMIGADREGADLNKINTRWTFTGIPKKMFLGKVEHHTVELNLSVAISVNEGPSGWKFKSEILQKYFTARIMDDVWLDKYQAGFIRPIGPKDIIKANVTYSLYTPVNSLKPIYIRNAKINKVLDVQRYDGYQYEISA